jgi:hypothetical protein
MNLRQGSSKSPRLIDLSLMSLKTYVFYNICPLYHNIKMNWKIIFQDDFDLEFDELNEIVQNECLAHLKVLEKFGPELGRPHVDTLKGSKHFNMKEH